MSLKNIRSPIPAAKVTPVMEVSTAQCGSRESLATEIACKQDACSAATIGVDVLRLNPGPLHYSLFASRAFLGCRLHILTVPSWKRFCDPPCLAVCLREGLLTSATHHKAALRSDSGCGLTQFRRTRCTYANRLSLLRRLHLYRLCAVRIIILHLVDPPAHRTPPHRSGIRD
jgi:hypothetical protein